MLNDNIGLLLALYRECTGCITLDEMPNSTIKQIMFFDETYELLERKYRGKFTWKMFNLERSLTQDEILYIFAMSNLKRHLLSKHF